VLKYRIEDGQVAGATLYLRDEQGNVLSEMQWVDTGAAGYWARAKDHVYLGRDLIGSFDRSTGEPHVVSYARDHLGSQRAEVWGLDTSTATDLWPYGALARTKAAGGPPALANGAHLFTGHEREYTGSEALADPLMGLDYMHARYYSHTLGRFLSVDPVGGKPGLSQSWNRYAYVQGNPVSTSDPDGRCLEDVCVAEGAAVLALASATVAWWEAPSAAVPGRSNGQVIVESIRDTIHAVKNLFRKRTKGGDHGQRKAKDKAGRDRGRDKLDRQQKKEGKPKADPNKNPLRADQPGQHTEINPVRPWDQLAPSEGDVGAGPPKDPPVPPFLPIRGTQGEGRPPSEPRPLPRDPRDPERPPEMNPIPRDR